MSLPASKIPPKMPPSLPGKLSLVPGDEVGSVSIFHAAGRRSLPAVQILKLWSGGSQGAKQLLWDEGCLLICCASGQVRHRGDNEILSGATTCTMQRRAQQNMRHTHGWLAVF